MKKYLSLVFVFAFVILGSVFAKPITASAKELPLSGSACGGVADTNTYVGSGGTKYECDGHTLILANTKISASTSMSPVAFTIKGWTTGPIKIQLPNGPVIGEFKVGDKEWKKIAKDIVVTANIPNNAQTAILTYKASRGVISQSVDFGQIPEVSAQRVSAQKAKPFLIYLEPENTGFFGKIKNVFIAPTPVIIDPNVSITSTARTYWCATGSKEPGQGHGRGCHTYYFDGAIPFDTAE